MLVRQNMRDAAEDYKSVVLALAYGGVPSINSLQAIYNFQVRIRVPFAVPGAVLAEK